MHSPHTLRAYQTDLNQLIASLAARDRLKPSDVATERFDVDGVRVLSRKTVELMMANHLNDLERTTHQFSESDGFGLGGGVRVDLAKSNTLGSVGQFGWDGAATTLARLDPKERTVMILLVQHFPFDEYKLFGRFTTLVYAAIVD